MAVESKTSVKARFETNDTPTEGDFGNLIDSYQDTFGVLQAIGTAAQGGKAGIIEIKATAEVSVLPISDTGRAVLAASSDSTDAGIQVVQSTSQASARQAIGIDGSGAVIDSGDLKPFLRPSTDILWIPANAWVGDVDETPAQTTIRLGTSAATVSGRRNNPTGSIWSIPGSSRGRIWFSMIHPNSMPDGKNPYKFQVEWFSNQSTCVQSSWEIGVSDGWAPQQGSGLTFATVTAISTSSTNRDRIYTTTVTASASSNKGHGISFRIEIGTADSSDANYQFTGLSLIIPVSAHNED